jgi:hypothetical protein
MCFLKICWRVYRQLQGGNWFAEGPHKWFGMMGNSILKDDDDDLYDDDDYGA